MQLHEGAVREFGAKLRLTAAALGCGSQKELAAAFRRASPDTAFELARSYRWMGDRALPRARRVYDEWAALLALDRPADWLLGCGLDEFAALLAVRHGTEPGALRARAGLAGPDAVAAGRTAARRPAEDDPACGVYACYSHAQSPYFRGRVSRGTLLIAPAPRRFDGLVATYDQALPGGPAHASGPVQSRAAALCATLLPPNPALAPVSLSLFRPNPPASVLAGLMLGVTALSPGLQTPYATRIAALRVPGDAAETEASNRYLDPGEWPPGRELAALGLAAAAELAAGLAAFLAGGAAEPGGDNVSADGHVALVAACDRAWLATSRAA